MTTLSYYTFADEHVAIIRRWYFKQYGIKITKKHAVLFAIGNINLVSSKMEETVRRLRFKFMETRSVGVDNYPKAIIDKIRMIAMSYTSVNKSTAVTICIIQFALGCKLQRRKLVIQPTPLSKEDKQCVSDYIDDKLVNLVI